MSQPPAELLQLLERIRTEQGEPAYQNARKAFVLKQIGRPGAEETLREWFPDLDIDALKSQATSAAPPLHTLQGLMPGVRTEAQARLTVACFEALKAYLEANFTRNMVAIHMAKDALDKALSVVANLLYVEDGVQEIPVEQRSSVAQSFMDPPKGHREQEVLDALLDQLSKITTNSELQDWYQGTSADRNKIVTPSLRNQLFDTIRAKRRNLEPT